MFKYIKMYYIITIHFSDPHPWFFRWISKYQMHEHLCKDKLFNRLWELYRTVL